MLRSFFDIYCRRGERLLSVLVVTALAAMLVLNAVAVLVRLANLGAIHWAHEVSMVLALGVYFLAYGIIVRRSGEIRVEAFATRLPGAAQEGLEFFGDVAQLSLYSYIGYLGLQYADRVSVLPMPMTRASEAWTILPLALGFLDAAIVIVGRFVTRQPGGPASPTGETEI